MDKARQVGDFRKIGDRLGTVEAIEFRSIELRSLDQSLLTIPSGSLTQVQFENTMTRARPLIDQLFLLRMEIQVEQLRFALDSVQKMLEEQLMIESGTSRARVINFYGRSIRTALVRLRQTGLQCPSD